MEIQNVRQRRMPRVAKTKNNVQENVQVRIRQCLEHDELHEGTRRSDHTRLDRELDEPVDHPFGTLEFTATDGKQLESRNATVSALRGCDGSGRHVQGTTSRRQ